MCVWMCVICSCSYCLLLPWHILCRLSREGKTIWYSWKTANPEQWSWASRIKLQAGGHSFLSILDGSLGAIPIQKVIPGIGFISLPEAAKHLGRCDFRVNNH